MDEFENALAWFKSAPKSWLDSAGQNLEGLGQWIWEVIQGDFNDDQTTGQIVTGTVISMIPFVDQICDVRDLCANSNNIRKDETNVGAWIGLCLTLIGLFPVLGSFAKGACKVMFLYLRRAGFDVAGKVINKKAYDTAIGGLNKFLEMPATRKTLKALKIYNPYEYLAKQVRLLQSKVNVSALLGKLNELMNATKSILNKASDWGPKSIKQPIKNMLDQLVWLRSKANSGLAKAVGPMNEALDKLAKRLEIESDLSRRAITGTVNPHAVKSVTEAQEAVFLRRHKPRWVDEGVALKYKQLESLESHHYDAIDAGWGDISSKAAGPLKSAFETFNTLRAVELKPGEKLYRVVSPKSADNSICWMRESEFKKLKSKADWRRYFAVWKNWNDNGEFLTYIVPPGKPLKAWEGKAASQKMKNTEFSLEGGYTQIVVDPKTLDKKYANPRQTTGWGYTDGDIPNDLDAYLGVPKLEQNWR
jgi:hypothetical protein